MPSSELRQNILKEARKIVVKVGSQLLHLPKEEDKPPRLDLDFIAQLADQIAEIKSRHVEVSMVCSGAIGAGCAVLGINQRPQDIPDLQAIAAVGQRALLRHLHDAFARHDIEIGQLLLTRGDFEDRDRYLNLRNCVQHLHQRGCIPIANENDTVAVDEIRLGDNDTLAALLTNSLRADALILLTVVDGLLDKNGERVDLVSDTQEVRQLINQDKSSLGTGGFFTKLEAARLVTEAGEMAVVASGREKNVLTRLINGEKIGTVFMPAPDRMKSRSRWIGLTKKPAGHIVVDNGARTALTERGKSLLAKGILKAHGDFSSGDLISVQSEAGQEFARGLSNYSMHDIELIKGKRSSEFIEILGHRNFTEVIHRDNLVIR